MLSYVLKFSQYLRLGVLINEVLIKKKECISLSFHSRTSHVFVDNNANEDRVPKMRNLLVDEEFEVDLDEKRCLLIKAAVFTRLF